jgi:hypothetical protein
MENKYTISHGRHIDLVTKITLTNIGSSFVIHSRATFQDVCPSCVVRCLISRVVTSA